MKNQVKKNQSIIIELVNSNSLIDKLLLILILALLTLIFTGASSLIYLLITEPSSFDSVGGVIMSSFVVLRQQISHRGGGIEIDLEPYGYEGEAMTAYQNYLGGGMLGSIQNDCTITDWKDDSELTAIADELSRYFHSLTVHDDEWEGCTYEENQLRPITALYSKQVSIKTEDEWEDTQTHCDICEEEINMDEDFYRYGTTHEGKEVMCCEECERNEIDSSASCVPYGDYNYDVGERYSFSPLFGALNPYLEELWGKEVGEFPVKKMEWKSTDGWRGYYDLEFQDGWRTFDGWITGWVDDTISHKRFVLEFLDDLREENETLDFPLWIITTQTSNVFSTATDIIFREEDSKEFEQFLIERYGKNFEDLKKSLS